MTENNWARLNELPIADCQAASWQHSAGAVAPVLFENTVAVEVASVVEFENIVPLSEAHTGGMCKADPETKRTFADDVLNLTLAAPEVNRAKGALDAFDWMLEQIGAGSLTVSCRSGKVTA